MTNYTNINLPGFKFLNLSHTFYHIIPMVYRSNRSVMLTFPDIKSLAVHKIQAAFSFGRTGTA